jgi:hypothetical protein
MAAFAPGQVIVTSDPFVQVDPLPAGIYRFQLVVEDQAGNDSLPMEEVTVQVVAPQPVVQPTPIFTRPRIPIVEETTTRIPIFKRPLVDF